MAKDRNSLAKRQREVEKKRKAQEKREHRLRKKERPEGSTGGDGECDDDAEPEGG